MLRRTFCWSATLVTCLMLAVTTMADEPPRLKQVSPHDFAQYYEVLNAWHNEPVGQMATVAFEQAGGGCSDAGCDCQSGGSDCQSGACDCDSSNGDCGCSACNTCATCDPCCCPPLWEARVAFLALCRDLDHAPLITDGANATLLSSSQFDTGYEPGVEFSLRAPIGDSDCQVRYIHSDSFNEAINRPLSPALEFITGGPTVGVTDWSYQSRLYNLELNFIQPNPNSIFEGFIGLAYVRYEEAINAAGVNPFLTNETENDLYGFQIGGNAVFYDVDRLSVAAMCRGGIYYARSKTAYTEVPPLPRVKDKDNNVAFLGEVGLMVDYLLFGNTSVEASYHALWLSGAALAGEQLSTTTSPGVGLPGNTQLNQGDILFHGFNLGLVTRW